MFNFIMKQAMKSQMKGVPEDQKQKVMELIDKNPDFFKDLAQKVKAKIDAGQPQMEAMMSVMKENESELKEMLK